MGEQLARHRKRRSGRSRLLPRDFGNRGGDRVLPASRTHRAMNSPRARDPRSAAGCFEDLGATRAGSRIPGPGCGGNGIAQRLLQGRDIGPPASPRARGGGRRVGGIAQRTRQAGARNRGSASHGLRAALTLAASALNSLSLDRLTHMEFTSVVRRTVRSAGDAWCDLKSR